MRMALSLARSAKRESKGPGGDYLPLFRLHFLAIGRFPYLNDLNKQQRSSFWVVAFRTFDAHFVHVLFDSESIAADTFSIKCDATQQPVLFAIAAQVKHKI